jgi:DNA-binding NtrC family response regulator
LPPLRERGEDVLLLAGHFLKLFRAKMNKNISAISGAARQKLLGQPWPGNVRELRNVIERALILETGPEISPASLPEVAGAAGGPKPFPGQALMPDETLDAGLERIEREIISAALEKNNLSLTRASEQLKLTRHSLRYRMQRLNMKLPGADAVDSGAPVP